MTIVEMSAGGAVLIAAILMLRRALLHRLPKWTFLLLWAVALCRLLVPVTLPSQLSVYTGAARIAQAFQEEEEPPADVRLPVPAPPLTAPGTFREDGPVLPAAPAAAEPEKEPVSPLAAVWLTGTSLCGLFFAAAYLWTLRRFWDAVPAESEFLTRWREEHPTLRTVQVKTCGAVNAPVAYGLICPVILLPENTDWADEGQLTYILTHEYVHIRRGDLLWKLLLTAALCVHWFNPLVWAMYFCANRDLELACDEAVVRTLGLDNRKGYAYALLSAAESGFSPLCLTYTTKNHMEERIRAIMKMKKRSVAAILTAALLVAGVTAVFATSKAQPKDIGALPRAVQTDTGPALGDKSARDNRVHPVAPADTSTPEDSRVHPVTGQPAGSSADTPQEPAAEKTAPELEKSSHPVNSKGQTYGDSGIVSPDANTPDLIEVPHIVDGKNVLGGVRCYVRKEDIMPYRYPGEINNPDDAMDYMAWMRKLPYSVTLPAFDQEGRSLGTTEVLLNDSAKGSKLDPAQMEGLDLEAVREEVKNNRWDVPYGEVPEGTEFTVTTPEEANELCDFLHNARGIKSGDLTIIGNSKDGTYTVCVSYFMTRQEEETKERLSNGYPVNSRGETYGKSSDINIMGYAPELVAAVADNGAKGYMLYNDYEYFGYPGKVETQEDMKAFVQWQDAQSDPITLPVYDVDRSNIVGCYTVYNSSTSDEPTGGFFDDNELKWLEDSLRRVGIKEGDIAREVEKHRAPEG